jgi:hypothetical protein
MKKEDVDKFEKIQGQIKEFHSEISILAKKTPNDGVNKFKLGCINEVLLSGNCILGKNYKPLESFNQFDDEELPSNSDVAFILSQYLSCFEKLRADSIYSETDLYDVLHWYWKIDNNKTKIETAPPKKIKKFLCL